MSNQTNSKNFIKKPDKVSSDYIKPITKDNIEIDRKNENKYIERNREKKNINATSSIRVENLTSDNKHYKKKNNKHYKKNYYKQGKKNHELSKIEPRKNNTEINYQGKNEIKSQVSNKRTNQKKTEKEIKNKSDTKNLEVTKYVSKKAFIGDKKKPVKIYADAYEKERDFKLNIYKKNIYATPYFQEKKRRNTFIGKKAKPKEEEAWKKKHKKHSK